MWPRHRHKRKKVKAQPSIEWRVIRFVVLTVFWRLPRLVFRLIRWMARGLAGLFFKREPVAEPGDQFYRSYQWRKLRVAALEANRERYGLLACECCGMVDVGSFHVDHIYPRSTHPDLALDPDNLQVLCDQCNIGKGTDYTTNWRGGTTPKVKGRRGWRRFLLRT